LLLRFTWSLKLSSHLHVVHELEQGTFFLEALEVLRRWIWVFVRIEWEGVRSGVFIGGGDGGDGGADQPVNVGLGLQNASPILEEEVDEEAADGSSTGRPVERFAIDEKVQVAVHH
jgi:hypothetical protein